MAKFIEIRVCGMKKLLNLDTVSTICKGSNGEAYIYCTNDVCIETEESYDQIRQMIGSTQGGIPILH